jgi:hypothetical protein
MQNGPSEKPPTLTPGQARRPAAWTCTILWVWMLGVMLLAWVLLEGPVVSSIIKRVAWLSTMRQGLERFFGGG